MGLMKRAMERKIKRSRKITGATLGRCTFTATSSPVPRSTALYTCSHYIITAIRILAEVAQ